jgi:hypothetical protein
MKKHLLLFWLILCAAYVSCKRDSLIPQELSLSLIAEIGIDEAKTKEEEPYQFSYILSVDCDKEGNIYVLDHKDVCVKIFDKNGTFLRQILSEGEGPNEITNPYGVRINKFSNSLFVLHEHGYRLKEFDVYGTHLNQYSPSEQIVHYFDFLDTNTLVYISKGIYGEDGYKSIKLIELDSSEIIQEFAPTKRPININGYQRFVCQDEILWTCPGDLMEFVGFNIRTGDILRTAQINTPYIPYKFIKKEYGSGTGWVSAQIYNFAQPFFINDNIFVILTQQEFPEYTSQERPPPPYKRTLNIYRFENSELVDVGSFPELDYFIDIQACWQNRIIASCSAYDLVPKIFIFELN